MAEYVPLGRRYESASRARKSTNLLRKIAAKLTITEQVLFIVRRRLRDRVCLTHLLLHDLSR